MAILGDTVLYSAILSYNGQYRAIISNTCYMGLYWAIHDYSGPNKALVLFGSTWILWAVLSYTGLYWAALGYT